MRPGPTQILKVPGCQEPVQFFSFASGNTFGARYWTDGKRCARMAQDNSLLKKVPSQGVLFWWDACELIGYYGGWEWENPEMDPSWLTLESVQEPDEADYLRAIREGMGYDEDRLKYLHIRYWWAGNDAVRKDPSQSLSDEQLEQLAVLKTMLSVDVPNERLLRAEICRELGNFDEALGLLRMAVPSGYRAVIKRISRLCYEGNRRVATLHLKRH